MSREKEEGNREAELQLMDGLIYKHSGKACENLPMESGPVPYYKYISTLREWAKEILSNFTIWGDHCSGPEACCDFLGKFKGLTHCPNCNSVRYRPSGKCQKKK